MPRKRFKAEEIIQKFREAEVLLSQGKSVAEACRQIVVTDQTYYRWRKEYGGVRTDQAKRLKGLDRERAPTRSVGPAEESIPSAGYATFIQYLTPRILTVTLPFAFGFLSRKHPALSVKFHVPGFDSEQLLRAAPGFPRDDDQISKAVIRNRVKQGRILVCGHKSLTTVGRWSFKLCNRISFNVSQFRRPAHTPFHATDVVTAGFLRQVRVTVYPLFDMKRSQFRDRQIGIPKCKSLETVAIPLVSIGSALRMSPLKELVDQRHYCIRINACFSRLSHQFVKSIPCPILIRAEIVASAAQCHVPAVTCFPEPRFCPASHYKPSSQRT